jgi:hypothetical protein
MKKELRVKLVIYEDYNEMLHGQQYIKFLPCYVIRNTSKFHKAHQLVIQLSIVRTAGILRYSAIKIPSSLFFTSLRYDILSFFPL